MEVIMETLSSLLKKTKKGILDPLSIGLIAAGSAAVVGALVGASAAGGFGAGFYFANKRHRKQVAISSPQKFKKVEPNVEIAGPESPSS